MKFSDLAIKLRFVIPVAAAFLATIGCISEHASTRTTPSPQLNEMTGTTLSRLPTHDQLVKKAWRYVLEQIKSNPDMPSWDTAAWYTKCDVDLLDCSGLRQPYLLNPTGLVEQRPRKRAITEHSYQYTAPEATRLNLSRSLRTPVQVGATLGRINFESAPAHLATVVFNDNAKKKLSTVVSDWRSGSLADVGTMAAGSVLAKGIWEAIPMDGHRPARFSVFKGRKYTGSELPSKAFKDVTLNEDAPFGDDACARAVRDKNVKDVSPFCFHAYSLEADSDLLKKAQKTIELPHSYIENCEGQRCYFVLLGIHFMVRLDPKDDADIYDPSHPWLFFTLFWTGQDNKFLSQRPWKYYQIDATQYERNDANGLLHSHRNFCFNPYLEGKGDNGAISNCVSCHKWSRLSLDKEAKSVIGLGAGSCFGSRPLKFYGKCTISAMNSQDCLSETEFDKLGKDADRVWSLATLNSKKVNWPPCGPLSYSPSQSGEQPSAQR